MKPIASSRRSVATSGSLAILGCGRLRCAPLGNSFGTHQATGVAHHLLFPVEGGSTCCLAIRHLADVGISGPLQTGLGFFGLLNAALSALPYGWVTTTRVAQVRRLSLFCIRYRMDLGRLCYTGSLGRSRRMTLDHPDSTACHFGASLNSLLWLVALLRCL